MSKGEFAFRFLAGLVDALLLPLLLGCSALVTCLAAAVYIGCVAVFWLRRRF